MNIIVINDYILFLGLAQEGKIQGKFESFQNRYHPWGAAWNARKVDEEGLQSLKTNGVDYSKWAEDMR